MDLVPVVVEQWAWQEEASSAFASLLLDQTNSRVDLNLHLNHKKLKPI